MFFHHFQPPTLHSLRLSAVHFLLYSKPKATKRRKKEKRTLCQVNVGGSETIFVSTLTLIDKVEHENCLPTSISKASFHQFLHSLSFSLSIWLIPLKTPLCLSPVRTASTQNHLMYTVYHVHHLQIFYIPLEHGKCICDLCDALIFNRTHFNSFTQSSLFKARNFRCDANTCVSRVRAFSFLLSLCVPFRLTPLLLLGSAHSKWRILFSISPRYISLAAIRCRHSIFIQVILDEIIHFKN